MEREKISQGLQGIEDEFIVLAKSDQNSEKKRGWYSSKWGKIAMVACLPLLCAAGISTGVFVDVVTLFSPLLGVTPIQTEIIQEIGRPIGASVTHQGVTVTVDAIIGDGNMATVIYSFSYEDGSPFVWQAPPPDIEADEEGWITSYRSRFDDYVVFNSGFWKSPIEIRGNGTIIDGSGSRSYEFVDLDPEDGTSQYMETLSYADMPIGKKVTCVFYNFGYHELIYKIENGVQETKSETFFPLIEGEWELEYRFDYGDSSKTLLKNAVFPHEGKEIHVNEMVISPLSLGIDLEFEKIALDYEEMMENDQNSEDIKEGLSDSDFFHMAEMKVNQKVYENIPLYVTKKDGEVLEFETLTGGMSMSSGNKNAEVRIQLLFEEIIPLEEIVSVTFGEITTEVSQ